MEITRPDYYKEFSCIAGACPDTCCAGWQIVIDDKSLKKYKRVKGTFRNRLHNDIDWKEKVFRQYEKRCAFLNEDSLCDIYSEVGKRMLCDTCRKYPRHIEEFEGLREYSLSLSCPEAARILLGRREKVTFQTAEVPSPEETYDDFDYMLFTALEDTREYFLEVLQNRQIPMRLRMWKILAAASDFQRCADRNQLFKWEEIRERHKASAYGEAFTSKVQKHMNTKDAPDELLKAMWKAVIPKMEVLRPGWQEFLKKNGGITRREYSRLTGLPRLKAIDDLITLRTVPISKRLTRTGIFRKSSCLCIGFTHISAVLFTTAKFSPR